MPTTLAALIRTYLDDDAFQDTWQQVVKSRDASIPEFKRIVSDFVAGTTNISTFRTQVNKALLSIEEWGANGTGWMMEINKLAKNYGAAGEPGLRQTLSGLNAVNLGERIEQFFTFAVEQKQALQQQGSRKMVSPGNSAFIVSLFAFWLDRDGGAHVYYITLRKGLKRLLDAGLLPQSIGLKVHYDAIIVQNEADHRAAQQALATVAAANPTIKTDPYWAEKFFYWLDTNLDALETQAIAAVDSDGEVLEHLPLAPIPAALLAQRIAELRRRILIDEDVVRRIYHGLLAGHVILTGPPGTGKTELARLIPELLWQSEEATGSGIDPYGNPISRAPTTHSAYTTRLVTATDEWSVRTLVGGIAPVNNGGTVTYRTQYGHLAEALFSNWAISRENTNGWVNPDRVSVRGTSVLSDDEQEFRGVWLVIDEFNRAPIDLALGEALTALGGAGRLRVPIDSGSAELPLPQDFRIIGTLNSFDRNYLNQISEALKRRFAFIEVLPPARTNRDVERAIVLYKALSSVRHLTNSITIANDGALSWDTTLTIRPDPTIVYRNTWLADAEPVREIANSAWHTVEVIRVYRQLGTAQAIALFRHLLIAGLVEGYTTRAQWYAALDRALCDTVADQLQVLLPDELQVLTWYATLDDNTFITSYRSQLEQLRESSERRFAAQLEVLGTITRDDGSPLLTDSDLTQMLEATTINLQEDVIRSAFRQEGASFTLPQFARRLRAFRTDRGL